MKLLFLIKKIAVFLWEYKFWWILPIIVIGMIILLLVLLGKDLPLGPFIYPQI